MCVILNPIPEDLQGFVTWYNSENTNIKTQYTFSANACTC